MKINDFDSWAYDRIQDGCQIDPHGTLFRHFNIYNFLLDNICFQKKLVSLNIPGGAREAPLSTRLFVKSNNCNLTLIKQCYAGGVFCRNGCPMPVLLRPWAPVYALIILSITVRDVDQNQYCSINWKFTCFPFF